MWVRERLEAVQWWPDQPHPSVKTSVLEAGMDRYLHTDLAHELDMAAGQLGAIRTLDDYARAGWQLVKPGDWIVKRDRWEVVDQAEFSTRFEPVP